MTYIENIFICMVSPLLVAALCMGRRQLRFFLFCIAGMGVCLLSAYINTFLAAVCQADALAAAAKAQARRQIEDAQRRTREAEARYQKLQQDADGFLAPEQSCAQQAKIIADSMRSMYLGWFGLASTTGTPLARMAAPIYQVCDEIRESLEEDTTINPTAEGSVEDAEREALFE